MVDAKSLAVAGFLRLTSTSHVTSFIQATCVKVESLSVTFVAPYLNLFVKEPSTKMQQAIKGPDKQEKNEKSDILRIGAS